MKNSRENPRDQRAWGLYNYGILWTVERTRRQARMEAERIIGKPWAECRTYMEVHKVTVRKLP